jgi:hypothetical protein
MTKKRSSRHNHTASTSGTGKHFTSPLKARNPLKNKKAVVGLGRKSKMDGLRGRLELLLNPTGTASGSSGPPSLNHPDETVGPTIPMEATGDMDMDNWVDVEPPLPTPIPIPAPTTDRSSAKKKRHTAWDLLLPCLEELLAQY